MISVRVPPLAEATPIASARSARLRGWVLGGAAAAVAAAVLALALVIGRGGDVVEIDPQVEMLASQHLGSDAGFDPMLPDEVDDPGPADIGHGMDRDGIYQGAAVTQVRYSDGVHAVSVFRQSGDVRWDMLPAGDMVDMAGRQAWNGVVDGADVIVVEGDHQVVTLVADPGMGELLDDELVELVV